MSVQDSLKEICTKAINEKLHAFMNRLDDFQNNVNMEIDALKKVEGFLEVEINEPLPDIPGPADPGAGWELAVLHDYIDRISQSGNQLSLIQNLLEGINQFSARAALFLLKDDKLVGWKGRGFRGGGGEISDDDIKSVFFSLSADTVFRRTLEQKKPFEGPADQHADDFLIYDRLGLEKPPLILVIPFLVKGKPQAVIYCDGDQEKALHRQGIEILARVGEMSLDLLPLRQKIMARVKTQEFSESMEKEESVQSGTLDNEKTTTSFREGDPERLAKVIVNDIILYNRKVVDDGIRNGNLYEVLADTIMQSRELYLKKFSDLYHFENQLLQTLAQGNRKALSGYDFVTIP